MKNENELDFREVVIERCGFDPGEIVSDGSTHRVPTWGDPSGEMSGAYWHNGKIGWAQDWRTMDKPEIIAGELSVKDRETLNGSFNGAGQKISMEAMLKSARRIWDNATEPNSHPYLTRKKITAPPQVKMHEGCLVIPLFDINGQWTGLQRIDGEGRKRFLSGTRKKGSFYSISGNGTYLICEGLATGCSLHKATGYTIIIAFDAGNLIHVAKEISKKVDPENMIIGADNDHTGDENRGLKSAQRAAQEIGCRLAIPIFQSPDGKSTTDFNDLYLLEGSEIVRAQVEGSEKLNNENSSIDIEQQIKAIINLPMLQREVEISRIAKEHKIPKGVIVNYIRALQKDDEAEVIEEVEPYSHPVDGCVLLDSIKEKLQDHVVFHEGMVELISLYALFTYVYDAFRICPYLTLVSPEKRCGKSTCLTVLMALVYRGLPASNVSSAVIFRAIEEFKPSFIIDEARFLRDNKDMQDLVSGGYIKEMAFVLRCDGEDNRMRRFSTWCPKILALIGSSVSDTIDDRSVIVKMDRKSPQVKVKKIPLNFYDECLVIRQKCKRWADDNFTKLMMARPQVPESNNDRLTDKIEPLFAIAEIAGGHWPDLIRKSMLKMMRSPDESISVLLLQDIKDIFEQSFNDKMFSSDLVDKLKELSERPWSDWHKGKGLTTNGLAQQLKKFKVRSKGIRIEDTIKKGYCLDDFEYDFKRYLPDTPIQNVTPLQSNDISNLEQKQNGTEKNGVTFQKQDNQLNLFDCNGVTFQTGGEDEKKQIRYKNMPSHLHGHIDPKLAAEIYGTEE
jgi:putative DNA primase/helicase